MHPSGALPADGGATVAPGQLVDPRSDHKAVKEEEEELPRAIGGMTRTSTEDACGCGFPRCHSATTFQVVEQAPPMQFTDLYTQEEWSHLIEQVNEAYRTTYLPCYPLCCFFLCAVPCVPLWWVRRAKRQRQRRLAEVVERENARLQPQGLEWRLTPVRCRRYTQHMLMVLSWVAEVRPQWERRNPHRRPVSREALPPEFYSRELRARIDLAVMEQRAQAMGLVAAPGAQPVEAGLPMPTLAQAQARVQAQAQARTQLQQMQSQGHIDVVVEDPGEPQATPGVSVTYAQPPATPLQLPPPPYVSPPAEPAQPGMEWLAPGAGFLHPLCPPVGMASFCARCGVPRPSAAAQVCRRCGQLYLQGG